MPAKQLKISLLQVFSQLTTQRSGFRQNSCAVDEQACVFGSCAFNKHSVLKIFITDGLNAFSAPWYYSEMEIEPVAG